MFGEVGIRGEERKGEEEEERVDHMVGWGECVIYPFFIMIYSCFPNNLIHYLI